VRLSRKVDNRGGSAPLERRGYCRYIGNVSLDEFNSGIPQSLVNIKQAPGVGELIKNNNTRVCVRQQVMNKICSDEPGATSYKNRLQNSPVATQAKLVRASRAVDPKDRRAASSE
jgi:hypothetical protein